MDNDHRIYQFKLNWCGEVILRVDRSGMVVRGRVQIDVPINNNNPVNGWTWTGRLYWKETVRRKIDTAYIAREGGRRPLLLFPPCSSFMCWGGCGNVYFHEWGIKFNAKSRGSFFRSLPFRVGMSQLLLYSCDCGLKGSFGIDCSTHYILHLSPVECVCVVVRVLPCAAGVVNPKKVPAGLVFDGTSQELLFLAGNDISCTSTTSLCRQSSNNTQPAVFRFLLVGARGTQQ